jgi:hypothetical protein
VYPLKQLLLDRPTVPPLRSGINPADGASHATTGRHLRRDAARSPQLLDSDPEEVRQPGLRILTDRALAAQRQTHKREAQASPIGDSGEGVGPRPVPEHLNSVGNSLWHIANFTPRAPVVNIRYQRGRWKESAAVPPPHAWATFPHGVGFRIEAI